MLGRGSRALQHNRQTAAKIHVGKETSLLILDGQRKTLNTHRNASALLGSLGTTTESCCVFKKRVRPGEEKFSSSGKKNPDRLRFLELKMTHKYSQRSLIVLSLLGILSAIMSVLSVILIFQLQSQQATVKESPPATSALIPTHVWAVLLPVSTVLSALSLTLNLSSVVVCLLHSYFSTEVCRGEQDTDRYLFRMCYLALRPPVAVAAIAAASLPPVFLLWM